MDHGSVPSRKTKDLWARESVFPRMICTIVPLWTFQSMKCIIFISKIGLQGLTSEHSFPNGLRLRKHPCLINYEFVKLSQL